MAVIDGKIKCSRCKEFKTLEHYSVSTHKRGCGTCRPCKQTEKKIRQQKDIEKTRAEWRKDCATRIKKNPELWRSMAKAWRKRNPEKTKSHNLGRYGISFDEYKNILSSQNGGCAICETKSHVDGKKLFVDHCHDTGKIRGILCKKCNWGIGLLKDNASLVKKAYDYLIRGA